MAGLVVVLASVVGACSVQPLDASLAAVPLTVQPPDTYGITVVGGTATATAGASNTDQNMRVLFWDRDDVVTRDQQSCATWQDATGDLDQEGAALRVSTGDGATRAITVTKNIWGLAFWVFNIHVWDTSTASDLPATLLASFDLSATFGRDDALVPFPWRLCARVDGALVRFIAWPATDAPPSWDDPAHGGVATLPPGWDAPGHAGWYVGHLEAGRSVSFADRSTSPASPASFPEGSPSPSPAPDHLSHVLP